MNNEKYYVVRKGHHIGIFKTWGECKKAVEGYKNPIFRKFDTFEEAKEFLKTGSKSSSSVNITTKSSLTDKTIQLTTTKKSKTNGNVNRNSNGNGNGNDNANGNANTNTHTNETKSRNYVSDEDILKMKQSLSTIKSSHYSDDLNYNVRSWTLIDDELYIFTDGSSRKSKTKEDYFNSGVGVYIGLNCTNIKEQYNEKTNNQCELMGMDYAFKLIVKYYRELIDIKKVIKIVSDSEYSIKACSVWLSSWKKNNWRTAKGDDVKNKDLIESIDASMQRIKLINSKLSASDKLKVKLIHVNSHQAMDRTDRTKFDIWFGNLCADGLACNKL
jgi:ribonuclease HI